VSNARLPDNIRAIWTPRDAVDTAAQFHLEVDNAERGVEIADRAELRQAFDPQGWLMSQGRERRARIMDGLAVALLMALMGALGCAVLLMAAPKAKADIDAVSVAYAAHYADAICDTLAGHPTNSGVQGILAAIREDGLTNLQAAGAVVLAVTDACPAQTYVLERFADRWAVIEERTV
jgi:hypothetical protein